MHEVRSKSKIIIEKESGNEEIIRIDELAKSLPKESFTAVKLNSKKAQTVWVAIFTGKLYNLEGKRSFAIIMNADSFEKAKDIDYLFTNVESSIVNETWIVSTYSH